MLNPDRAVAAAVAGRQIAQDPSAKPLTIFLHAHKAAGTAVVRAAVKSGLRLPLRHRNGNLVDDANKVIIYRQKQIDEVRTILLQEVAGGVEFLAMEFDFPPVETLKTDIDLRIFTVLRNPLARAISNFRMEKIRGSCDLDLSFRDYIRNRRPTSRADNYYTKMLARLGSADEVTIDHYVNALELLHKLDKVIILEHGNLYDELKDLGFTGAQPPRRRPQALALSPRLRGFPLEKLVIPPEEQVAFCRRNHYDFALYSEFATIERRPLSKLPQSPS